MNKKEIAIKQKALELQKAIRLRKQFLRMEKRDRDFLRQNDPYVLSIIKTLEERESKININAF